MLAQKLSHTSLKNLGEENIKDFASTIQRLFLVEQSKFDLVIACGNTGLYIAELMKITLRQIGKKTPPLISIPLQRFKNKKAQKKFDSASIRGLKHLLKQLDPVRSLPEIVFDNSLLLPELLPKVRKLKKCKNILFVDDEIHGSLTVRLALDLLYQTGKVAKLPHITIVAENHNLLWPYHNPKMFLHFLPYGIKKGTGSRYNNIISHAIHTQAARALKRLFREKLDRKNYVSILLGLPIKVFDGQQPRFSHEYNQRVKERIQDFRQLSRQHREYLEVLVQKGLQE